MQDAPCKRHNLEYLFGLESKLTNTIILILNIQWINKQNSSRSSQHLEDSFFWLIFGSTDLIFDFPA